MKILPDIERTTLFLAPLLACGILISCERESPMERAADDAEDAAEEVADEIDDAID